MVTKLLHVRFAAPSQPDKMEDALYTPLATILQDYVQGICV